MNKKYPILFFSTADWDSPYKTNKQYVAESLCNLGYKVYFFESFGLRKPIFHNKKDNTRIFKKIKKSFLIKKINKNLDIVSFLPIPLWSNYFIKNINLFFLNYFIKKFILKDRQFNIWTYHPYVPKDLMNEAKKIIYHSVDDLSLIKGINGKTFNFQEKNFIKKTNHIFVTSKNLLKKYPKNKTYYFSNVINSTIINLKINRNFFKNITKPIVGFFGNLTESKLDYKLLLYTIKKLNQFEFIFIGAENENERNHDLKILSKFKNTNFIGYKTHKDTIKLAKNFSIGIIPFLKNKYTDNIFPMKYYEYIAAGIRVVSTNLSFTNDIDKKFIKVATSKKDFVNKIKTQIKKGNIKKNDRKKFLDEYSYINRTKKMIKICKI